MSPSSVAWLDVSADEQRRAREILALFAQTESRDELGIGQIRDVLSDALWPGTSVLQTRARYYLFVPWLFRQGAARGRQGPELYRWVQTQERHLIPTLKATGNAEGLIGAVVGVAVKVLPSTIYWSGMARYRICTATAPDQMGFAAAAGEHDEAWDRALEDWHPTLPPAAAGFPAEVPTGFDLSPAEAGWLAECMRMAAPATMLAHLLDAPEAPALTSPAPWEDPIPLDAPPGPATVLAHARRFAVAIRGAAMLYNLLVADRYEAAGLTKVEEPVESYRELLTDWAQTVAAADLGGWDRDAFWRLILAGNPRINAGTRVFVDTWLDAATAHPGTVADDLRLRHLIAEREKRKGSQSRLVNTRLVETWSGESGAGLLTYRWDRVRRIVTDIHEGIARAGT